MTIIEFIKSLIGAIGDSAIYISKELDEHGRRLPKSYGWSDTEFLQEEVDEMLKDKSSEITLTDDLIKIKNKNKKLKIHRK